MRTLSLDLEKPYHLKYTNAASTDVLMYMFLVYYLNLFGRI